VLNTTLPTNIYYAYSFQQRNAFNVFADGIDLDIQYRFETSVGAFNAGLAWSQKLSFDQQFGDGPLFDVLNTVGINTTFPSNETAARLSLGWALSGLSVDVFANYAGDYVYRGNSASPPYTLIRNEAQVVVDGGQPIDDQTTWDLHVAYKFGGEGMLSGSEVFFDSTNLFDEEPPAFNTAIGYDNFNANPIGRTLTLGVRMSW
jgi:iron complex outermembrane recepter protein